MDGGFKRFAESKGEASNVEPVEIINNLADEAKFCSERRGRKYQREDMRAVKYGSSGNDSRTIDK